MALRRVAIYGGTFDPVHNGHIEVARGVLQLFKLDEVIFVPACVPPHKRNANITSAFHRFAMLAWPLKRIRDCLSRPLSLMLRNSRMLLRQSSACAVHSVRKPNCSFSWAPIHGWKSDRGTNGSGYCRYATSLSLPDRDMNLNRDLTLTCR